MNDHRYLQYAWKGAIVPLHRIWRKKNPFNKITKEYSFPKSGNMVYDFLYMVHGKWFLIKSLAWVPGLTGSLGQCNACQTPVRKGNLYWRLKVILYCSSLYLSRTIVRRHMMHKVATVDWGVHLAVVYMQDPIPDPINHRRSVAKQGDPYISGIFTH